MIAVGVVSHVVVTALETARKFQSTVICKHNTSKMFEVGHARLLRLDKWYIDMMHAIQESVTIQYPTCYIPWLYPYEHLTFQSINIDFDPAFVLSFITSSVMRNTSIFVPNKSLTSLRSAWMASVCCPNKSLALPRSPWRAFTSPCSPSIASACFASKSFSSHCNSLMMPSSFCERHFPGSKSISNGGRRRRHLSVLGTDFAEPILIRSRPKGWWGVLKSRWILSILAWN